jgi:type IV secretory pathway VirB10-like protein
MLNLITENLTFFIIGLVVILIVIVAYITFIVPKAYTPEKENDKKTLVDMDEIDKMTNQIEEDDLESKPAPQEKLPEEAEPLPIQETLSTEEIIEEEDLESEHSEDNNSDEPNEEEKPFNDEETEEDKVETKEESPEEDEVEEKEEPVELGKYHILYREKDDKWYVKREGSDKTIRVLHTKKEAIAYATIKAINQDTNIVIHSKDGKIEKHGY